MRYLDGIVAGIDNGSPDRSVVRVDGGRELTGRLSALACGHNRELLEYEAGKPGAWQTAYGIEVRIPDHPFPLDKAVFMDFRQTDPEVGDEGSAWRVPSFLYVLPTDKDTVFLEETCLMSRVQMPFDELKRRLYRRMARMGLPLAEGAVLEEEASWIPLGGGLPRMPQRNVAFGAAAGLVHPGSGFSLYNSFRMAKQVADAIADELRAGTPESAAAAAYEVLWSQERVKRMGFYQFGMEMVLSLNIASLRNFFSTFYRLPFPLAHGFLSHRLSSAQLLGFAFSFFVYGNNDLRAILVRGEERGSVVSQPGGARRVGRGPGAADGATPCGPAFPYRSQLKHLVSPAGSGTRLAKAYLSGSKEQPKAQSVGSPGRLGSLCCCCACGCWSQQRRWSRRAGRSQASRSGAPSVTLTPATAWFTAPQVDRDSPPQQSALELAMDEQRQHEVRTGSVRGCGGAGGGRQLHSVSALVVRRLTRCDLTSQAAGLTTGFQGRKWWTVDGK